MKFLCLVYLAPGGLDGLSPAERDALDRDSLAYDQQLARDGHFIAASALQPVDTARTLRNRGGRRQIIDGPFAETKEVLVGFIFVEAAHMDEALRLAAGIPMARHATIEVRPELEI
ncbi:YciI family protein [Phenylobacterium sp.]|uniref:YciI family protein n=1 Tax=Phenylobacterium sp. TaxID=1871053 RepID=UPI002811D838|nr:YciI family protein [Phenylobacterium sp.]